MTNVRMDRLIHDYLWDALSVFSQASLVKVSVDDVLSALAMLKTTIETKRQKTDDVDQRDMPQVPWG